MSPKQHTNAAAVASSSSCSSSSSSSYPFFVVDPTNRVGKVIIPDSMVLHTKGSDAYQQQYPAGRTAPIDPNAKCTFSLCMLYQKRKCRSGVNCHQIHADRQFVTQLRGQAKKSTCCSQHSETVTTGYIATTKGGCSTNFYSLTAHGKELSCVLSLNSGAEQHVVPLCKLGRTAGLDALVVMRTNKHKTRLHIPMSRVCRLHQQQQCQYDKDCHNIHVCRNVWKALTEGTPQVDTTQEEDDIFSFSFPSAAAAEHFLSLNKNDLTATPTPYTLDVPQDSFVFNFPSPAARQLHAKPAQNTVVDSCSRSSSPTTSSASVTGSENTFGPSSSEGSEVDVEECRRGDHLQDLSEVGNQLRFASLLERRLLKLVDTCA
eukprot:TRINITY_DN2401_c0_g1_i1.p1 TRINITY_DN2401_c0_g1~~TRINITY_DN2401_c0_g1_i1.p1  ORF type:complete len:374 (-),score=49.81 TRINITY_DN2401_c0_g1_i1:220-1341(-)